MLFFVHIEKTAGLSFTTMLRRHYGLGHCDVLYDDIYDQEETLRQISFAQKLYPHLYSVAGHGLHPTYLIGKSHKLVTFLRDPVDRCFSHYQHQVEKMGCKLEFDQWIEQEEYRNFQTKRIAGKECLNEATNRLLNDFFFVGLLEEFDLSINLISNAFNIDLSKSKKRKKVNIMKSRSFRDNLKNNIHTLQLCKEANRVDQELYDYVKNVVFPEMILRYSSIDTELIFAKSPGVNEFINRVYRNVIYKLCWRLFGPRKKE